MPVPKFSLESDSPVFWDAVYYNGGANVIAAMPLFDFCPGFNRDTFAGSCAKYWSGITQDRRVMHITHLGTAAFQCATWLGPQTPETFREQMLGGCNYVGRHGVDAQWLDELYSTCARINMFPSLVYADFEDQMQYFELPDNAPQWAIVDGLSGDPRLPLSLSRKPSLAAYLKTRTQEAKLAWWYFSQSVQYGQLRNIWNKSPMKNIPIVSWNVPNYSWASSYEAASNLSIGTRAHLPMYDVNNPSWFTKYDQILSTYKPSIVAHIRPDVECQPALDLLKKYNIEHCLIFVGGTSDPTVPAMQAGLKKLIKQIKTTWNITV